MKVGEITVSSGCGDKVLIIQLECYFAGEGPFPGIIDMYGTGGGLLQYRAALLASKGFVTLALAYFNYEDLPKEMTLDLEYFDVGYSGGNNCSYLSQKKSY